MKQHFTIPQLPFLATSKNGKSEQATLTAKLTQNEVGPVYKPNNAQQLEQLKQAVYKHYAQCDGQSQIVTNHHCAAIRAADFNNLLRRRK